MSRKLAAIILVAMTCLISSCVNDIGISSMNMSDNFNTSKDNIISASSLDYTGEESGIISEDGKVEATQSFIQACGMLSGGYAAYGNGSYYYVNTEDGNRMYMCDSAGGNKKCIDSFENLSFRVSMTVGNDCVYYLRTARLDKPIEIGGFSIPFHKQLCRYRDGSVIAISDDNIISYSFDGTYLFYLSVDMNIYRIASDGTGRQAIAVLECPMNLQADGERLYAYMDEALLMMDYNGGNRETFNVFSYGLAVNDDDIYCIKESGALMKTSDYGISYETVNEDTSTFCIYGERLVYQTWESGEIKMSNADGGGSELMCSGECPLAVNGHLLCIADGKIKVIAD